MFWKNAILTFLTLIIFGPEVEMKMENRAPLGHVVMFLVSNGEIRMLISLPVRLGELPPIDENDFL